MHKSYRPKGTTVKAVQLTSETAEYAARWCNGALDKTPAVTGDQSTEETLSVKVPTLDGVLSLDLGQYLVLTSTRGFQVMNASEFEERYEPVRTTRSADVSN